MYNIKVFSDTKAFFQYCKKGTTAKSYMYIRMYTYIQHTVYCKLYEVYKCFTAAN